MDASVSLRKTESGRKRLGVKQTSIWLLSLLLAKHLSFLSPLSVKWGCIFHLTEGTDGDAVGEHEAWRLPPHWGAWVYFNPLSSLPAPPLT